MAVLEASKAPATLNNDGPATDGVLALLNSLQNCTSRADAYRRSLQCIASYLNSPFALLCVETATSNFSEQVSAGEEATRAWKRHCDGMLLAARHSGKSRARLFQSSGVDRTFAVLSAPIPDENGSLVGSLALVIDCENSGVAEARLSELTSLIRAAAVFGIARASTTSKINSGAGGASASLDKTIPASSGTPTSSTAPTSSAAAVSRLSGCESLHEFAFSMVNDLKAKIGADQVSMGIVRGHAATILCTSGFDSLSPRSPGSQIIQQAMSECLDARDIVCFQKEGQWAKESANTGHHLHRRWHEISGGAPVASIPLMHADQCVAVLSIRRPVEKPFELSQLQKISSVVSAYAPALRLLEHANRSVLRHAMESFAKNVARVFPRGSIRRPMMLGLTAAALGWFLLRDSDYIVSVPCEIAPARELQLAAPFQGVIAESCVQPGERVQAGQLLLRMETELLEIEYEAAQTQRQIAQLELAQHAAAGNLAETALADSRIQVAETTIATIRHQLEQAEVKAPSDGYVIAGQLDRRVGEVVPMGEPLLQFAAADEWVVKLHVPEYSVSHLNVQMKGEFAINARPEEACSFNLEQMEITAGNVNGQNVFVARGRIEGTVSPWLRSGMQGTAKVNAGQKPTWWVWFHRSLDALRLQVWKW